MCHENNPTGLAQQCVIGITIPFFFLSETEKTSNTFILTPDNTILGEDMYDARKKDIQYTPELDCLFTTVCPNSNTTDCSYGADENHRKYIELTQRQL